MDGIDRDDARLALRQMLDYFGPATEGRAAEAVNAWCDRIRPALATPDTPTPAAPDALRDYSPEVQAALRALEEHEWIARDGSCLLGNTTIAALIRRLATPQPAQPEAVVSDVFNEMCLPETPPFPTIGKRSSP